MRDICHQHNVNLEHCPVECVFSAIDGRVVFAWFPIRLRTPSGWFVAKLAWLRNVKKCRHIGFPSYYYTEIKESE